MKLKNELSILSIVLIVSIIAVISASFFIYEKDLLVNKLKSNELSTFRGFVEMSNESLGLDDEVLLINYINLLKKLNKNILYIVFYTNNGYILSVPHKLPAYVPKEADNIVDINNIIIASYEDNDAGVITDISQSVLIDNNPAGFARIGFSQTVLENEVKKTLAKTGKRIVLIALLSMLIGIAGSLIMAQRITNPVNKVIGGARKIGEGDLNQQISVKIKNEFGDMAEEFNKMALKLKELDEMKENFISSVSHELKSPLYHIKGYIDLILMQNKGKIAEESMEHFDVIKNNIKRLSNFVSDILDLAKIRSGSLLIKKSECNLKEIAEETISFFKPTAKEKNISLAVSILEELPDAFCDKEKITQVLHNLVGNAFKFTPDGGTIIIKAHENNYKIEVAVSDTGIGIPSDKLEMVFDKFKQIKENADKAENKKGTGLGLSIVKGIIDAHEEKIWVESEVDKGSDFIFSLQKNKDPKKNNQLSDKGLEKEGSKNNIVLIDDEKRADEIFGDMLRKSGYNVYYADSGMEGINMVLNIIPDLIVLDLIMPKMDGFEVIEKLKSINRIKNIPIVVLTASLSSKNRDKTISMGVTECIDKSEDEKSVLDKIKTIL